MKETMRTEAAVVTSKGQLVIPVRMRQRHKIKRGTHVCLIDNGKDITIQPITDEYIDSMKGFLGTGGKILRALLEEKKREREL